MASFFARGAVVRCLRYVKVANVPVQVSPGASVVFQRDFSYIQRKVDLSVQGNGKILSTHCTRYYAAANNDRNKELERSDEENQAVVKLTLFQRFKQMYRDYWYVLVPVHLITSAGWFGGFYYMAKSGIDVVALMESYNISQKIVSPLKDSSLGYFAISYAMYKIATPVRYTVTLGGTTISINYLQKWGYIKPVPTREQLKEIYNSKREIMMDTVKDKRAELRLKKEQLKDRTDTLIDDMERKIVTKINDTKKKTTNTIPKP